MNRFSSIVVLLLLCCANAHAGVLVDCENRSLSATAGEWDSLHERDSETPSVERRTGDGNFLCDMSDAGGTASPPMLASDSKIFEKPRPCLMIFVKNEFSELYFNWSLLRPV